MDNQRDELQKFYDLLNRFDTGMLITHSGPNGMHARPMAIGQIGEGCDLWFITGAGSPKTDEIRSNDEVLVTFQNKQNEFITLSGRAEIVRDRQKVDELWNAEYKAWFPEGQDDPNLTLIHVEPSQGEYWDNSGINKATYMVESLRALAAGDTPNIREGSQHGKVNI